MITCEKQSQSTSDLLIFQWGRLGDLVQAGAVAECRRRSGGRCALSYDERYREIVERLFPEIVSLPVDLRGIIAGAAIDSSQPDCLRNALREHAAYSTRVASHLVLSRSKAAALFSNLLNPARTLGYAWQDGALRPPKLLETYLQGNEWGKPLPVHLVDVWLMLAEIAPRTASFGETGAIGPVSMNENCRGIMVFADAGSADRTPPAAWLINLSRMLRESVDDRIILVGSASGKEARRWDAASDVIDLRGQTSLGQLIDLCGISRIAVGPDTGGLHLAAACGCRAIGLYVGGASALNTGPYSLHGSVAHDLQWTEREMRDIRDEILRIQRNDEQSPIAGSTINWCRPARDEAGVVYLPDRFDPLTADRLRSARVQFAAEYADSNDKSPSTKTEIRRPQATG